MLLGQLRPAIGPEVVDPQIHVPFAIAREGDLRAVGRPRGIELDRRVVGDLRRLAASRQDPEIAHRREGDRTAVRRHDRTDDAGHLLRLHRFERAMRDGVGAALERDFRGERHDPLAAGAGRRLTVAAAGRRREPMAPDVAVRRVEDFIRREPLRLEREQVQCTRGNDQTSAGTGARVQAVAGSVGDDISRGVPRGRCRHALVLDVGDDRPFMPFAGHGKESRPRIASAFCRVA